MTDYLDKCRPINGAYYAGELRWLSQEIARKRQGKLTRGFLLLQDNAPTPSPQVDMTAVTECGFEILPHPPYSPDIAPFDYYLLPKLKSHPRGSQYGSIEGAMEAICDVWAEALSCKSRTPRVNFPCLFLEIFLRSRLNLPA